MKTCLSCKKQFTPKQSWEKYCYPCFKAGKKPKSTRSYQPKWNQKKLPARPCEKCGINHRPLRESNKICYTCYLDEQHAAGKIKAGECVRCKATRPLTRGQVCGPCYKAWGGSTKSERGVGNINYEGSVRSSNRNYSSAASSRRRSRG